MTKTINGKQYERLPKGTSLTHGDVMFWDDDRKSLPTTYGEAEIGVRNCSTGYWRPIDKPNLRAKIAILQAALEGKIIEYKSRHNGRGWIWLTRPEAKVVFNFHEFIYRVKPEEPRIEKLMREHGVTEEQAKMVARVIHANYERYIDVIIGEFGLEINSKSIKYGCEQFTWEEIDSFARGKGWW